MKLLFALTTLLACTTAFANLNYYPAEFEKNAKSGLIKDMALKDELFRILSSGHQKVTNGHDIITTNCPTADCYRQIPLGYDNARKKLFGELDIKRDNRGYYVKDVYCNFEISNGQIAPGKIPSSTLLNCEHTWPQSRFSRAFPENLQKGDLNHLYITDSRANSLRSSNPFGEVQDGGHPSAKCIDSTLGKPVGGGGSMVFEPPAEHKGNVARALFYFSVRYKLPIDPRQEAILRLWHKDDPVDEIDRERNEKVFQMQNNRNPFVDYPELVDDIADF